MDDAVKRELADFVWVALRLWWSPTHSLSFQCLCLLKFKHHSYHCHQLLPLIFFLSFSLERENFGIPNFYFNSQLLQDKEISLFLYGIEVEAKKVMYICIFFLSRVGKGWTYKLSVGIISLNQLNYT